MGLEWLSWIASRDPLQKYVYPWVINEILRNHLQEDPFFRGHSSCPSTLLLQFLVNRIFHFEGQVREMLSVFDLSRLA